MVKTLIPCLGEERYLDNGLRQNLDALKAAVARDWDGLLLVFGREGVGKSTFAFQLAAYLDESFSLDRVAWTPEQFMEKVLSAPKHSCVVLDEAYLTFTNRSSIGQFQKTIISMLTMIRSRNLYLIVVSPTIFDLSKYLVVHRALAAFRCYHRGLERGYWELYGEEAKLQLYVKGRRDNDLRVAEADIRGRFVNWFPFDKEEYERGKSAAIEELRGKMRKTAPTGRAVELAFEEGGTEVLMVLQERRLLRAGALTAYAEWKGFDSSTISKRIRAFKINRLDNRLKSGEHNITTYLDKEVAP